MAPINTYGRGAGERGAALVEFALALPLLLVVIAGIVDFGFAFQRYEVITNAAREGARMAVLPVGYSTSEVQQRVRNYVQAGLSLDTAGLNAVVPLSSVSVCIAPMTLGSGVTAVTIQTARVTVSYLNNWFLLRPILGLINKSWGTSITLNAQSQMTLEPGGASASYPACP